MRATRLFVTLGAAGLMGFAGCGGDDEPAERTGQAASGDPKQVFASTCGGCHTLSAAGTSGSIGPNLDELKPDAARVEAAIKTGPSSMPENLLAGEDAKSVAQYVAENAGS